MKIMVDLLGVTQNWSPDTKKQVNVLVLSIAGQTIRVPVSEEVAAGVIRAAVHTSPAEAPAVITTEVGAAASSDPTGNDALDAALGDELTETPDEDIFGGDFGETPVDAPALFQTEGGEKLQETDESVDQDEPAAVQPAAEVEKPTAVEDLATPVETPKNGRQLPADVPLLLGRIKGVLKVFVNQDDLNKLGQGQFDMMVKRARQRIAAKDPAYFRMVQKYKMRRRAQGRPIRTAQADEAGNPVVDGAPRVERPAAQPGGSVVVRGAPQVPGGSVDDDGFAQG